ncbi:MAG: zinc-binding dehydrogenase [Candidatus Omnitrophica bacterium]|nr:zinc-binding dehydrogenase [Candidatus Omnitrophota bacterium]
MSIQYPFQFRAAILEENKKPLVIRKIEFPGPLQAGQILVKLFYSGICGKQIEEIDASAGPDAFLPHLLGHEASAEVLDAGPGVTKVKPGDLVVLHWMKGSGIHSATPLYYFEGKRINAGWVTTFNECAVVSENRVTPIDRNADLKVAALLGCVATTGVGVVVNEANVQPYDTVVIYGCGGIGLCAVQAAHMRYPRRLIAVDLNDHALEVAKQFGATDIINPSRIDPVKTVRELTKGQGASKVLITTGHPKAVELAINTTAVPGDCIIVGVPQKDTMIPIDAYSIMHKRTLRGTLGGSMWPDRDIPTYYSLYKEGVLKLDKLVSSVLEFDKINESISKMRSGMPGRCVIKF